MALAQALALVLAQVQALAPVPVQAVAQDSQDLQAALFLYPDLELPDHQYFQAPVDLAALCLAVEFLVPVFLVPDFQAQPLQYLLQEGLFQIPLLMTILFHSYLPSLKFLLSYLKLTHLIVKIYCLHRFNEKCRTCR